MKTRLALALFALTIANASGADDHPLVPRFPGSETLRQGTLAGNSFRLLVHPLENPSSSSPAHAETYLTVSGHISHFAYESPRGNSIGDVFHFYQSKLQSEGFEILYNCAGQSCSPSTRGVGFNEVMAPPDLGGKMQGKANGQRYFAAKLRRAEGDVYVALYATRAEAVDGKNDAPVYCNVIVVESPTTRKD